MRKDYNTAGISVGPEDFGSDVCPIELVDWSARLKWALNYGGRVLVHKVFPCPGCQHPIVALQLVTERFVRIVDAKEWPGIPGKLPTSWIANLFKAHACEDADDDIQERRWLDFWALPEDGDGQ
jgi:hypothetical protein